MNYSAHKLHKLFSFEKYFSTIEVALQSVIKRTNCLSQGLKNIYYFGRLALFNSALYIAITNCNQVVHEF
jgi:hypothetical protein